MGHEAGQTGQGPGAVAVGYEAGFTSQGDFAIAIGYEAGATGQGDNSIILNASGVTQNNTQINAIILNADTVAIPDPVGAAPALPGFFVKPIRDDGTLIGVVWKNLKYNTTTGEIAYIP